MTRMAATGNWHSSATHLACGNCRCRIDFQQTPAQDFTLPSLYLNGNLSSLGNFIVNGDFTWPHGGLKGLTGERK